MLILKLLLIKEIRTEWYLFKGRGSTPSINFFLNIADINVKDNFLQSKTEIAGKNNCFARSHKYICNTYKSGQGCPSVPLLIAFQWRE